jgi:hypothetical protein
MRVIIRGIGVLVLVMAGCGGDDEVVTPVDAAALDAAPPDAVVVPPDAAPGAAIEATVAYDGAAVGTLIVAAFTSFPPSGPPVAVAQQATPAFPVTVSLDGLEPATLHVLALLDVAPASPTQPGPEDLTSWSEPLEIEVGDVEAITLTLTDP